MKQRLILNPEKKEQLTQVCKALSVPIRLDILHYLAKKPSIISNIATAFDLPLSSAALHIKVLEKAGLLSVQPVPGSKGSQKLCGILIDSVQIDLFSKAAVISSDFLYRESMPVGCYFDYNVSPSCGMASATSILGYEDNIGVFIGPSRFHAQLVWLSSGFLEYRFSNTFLKSNAFNRIRFSFEICSEALGYNNEWPSDVTISVNQTELGPLHCSGDFGGRKGKLNPDWWNPSSTQFGELRTVEITNNGCYIDGQKISEHTIRSLNLTNNDSIRFKLEAKKSAKYCGGFNLFGEKFGDYPQDIVMECYLDEDNRIS